MALILVTGASTGLGLGAARALVDAGHDVVVHARTRERVEGLRMFDSCYDRVFADLGEQAQVVRLAEQLDGIGSFDAVIHNAGVIDGPAVFAVNLIAPYLLSALMVPPRRIIMLSSSIARHRVC